MSHGLGYIRKLRCLHHRSGWHYLNEAKVSGRFDYALIDDLPAQGIVQRALAVTEEGKVEAQ